MDAVLDLAQTLLTSPWLYALVAVLALFDAIFPVVTAETVVIAAAAYAATGEPNALLLIGAAWAGALIGDVAAHHLGRGIGPVTRWLRRGKLSGPLVLRAEQELRHRGGMLIISARFIPGGRTATTVASGMIAYPRARFVAFAAVAAGLWGIYSVGIGMLGGLTFRDQPLLGVGLGIAIALTIGGAIEALRALHGRRRLRPARRQRLSRQRSAGSDACPALGPDGSGSPDSAPRPRDRHAAGAA